MSFSRGSSPPRVQTCISYVSCIGSRFFTTSATWGVPYPQRLGFKLPYGGA